MSLSREIRQVLAEMELLAHGSVQSWNSSGRGGSDRLMPPGESMPPHLVWGERFARCALEKLPALLREACADLEAHRRRMAPVAASTVTLDELVLESGQGWEPGAVAQRYGISPAMVRRIRHGHGKDTETGQQLLAADLPAAERRRVVVSLKAKGLTQVQIAARLNCNQATVSRDLASAA